MAASLLARVYPKTLKAVETYQTETTVSLIPAQHNEPEGDGKIEIITPYEGGEYFRPYAVADIKRQRKPAEWGERDTIKIGHLYVEDKGGKVQFADPLPRHPSINAEDVIPVNIRLLGSQRELLQDRQSSHWAIEYKSSAPNAPFVQIDAEIWDEDSLTENMADPDRPNRQRTSTQVAEQMRRRAEIEQCLQLRLYISVDIPRGKKRKADVITITEMTLDWPVATAYKLADLRVGEAEKPIYYDPSKQGVLRWHDVEMSYRDDSSSGVWRYSAEPLTLTIRTPGEIYRKTELKGKFTVKVPYLVSGLELAFFNAVGLIDSLDFDQHTIIKADYTIAIDRFFEMRTYSPRQQIYFQNVLMEEARIDDVKALLVDMGLRFEEMTRLSADSCLLQATKPHLTGQLELWVLMTGTKSSTFREDSIHGDVVYMSELPTGHTTITLCCQASLDSRYLTNLMKEIHAKLKERFRHVSTVG